MKPNDTALGLRRMLGFAGLAQPTVLSASLGQLAAQFIGVEELPRVELINRN
jgi:hypothetical protein